MAVSVRSVLDERLAGAAVRVEERLRWHLDEALAQGAPERLVAAMRHALLAGGKRFRPFLVLEVAALSGSEPAGALDIAAALECVHAYSLVHDDLPAMDNDELRRGRPTVWKAYDEWTAILAGDALLTFAFEIVAQQGRSCADATLAATLVRELAMAAGPAGMVGGQVLDLEADKLGVPAVPDAAHVRRLQALKTGRLIRYACRAGALVAGADPDGLAAATTYGEALGLAFQIADDLLDVTGDAAVVGKAVGKDAAMGKATLVAVLGEADARRQLDEAVATAVGALGAYGSSADALRDAARMQASRDR
ncbi:MAG: polyprenyl synthetase family protein [Hyphomicrobiaceae bacterium]|nr:polyprenyl synthetase family protein [Hyphomicrobiaceae bacterium]